MSTLTIVKQSILEGLGDKNYPKETKARDVVMAKHFASEITRRFRNARARGPIDLHSFRFASSPDDDSSRIAGGHIDIGPFTVDIFVRDGKPRFMLRSQEYPPERSGWGDAKDKDFGRFETFWSGQSFDELVERLTQLISSSH